MDIEAALGRWGWSGYHPSESIKCEVMVDSIDETKEIPE
jgi:hypothetical protein